VNIAVAFAAGLVAARVVRVAGRDLLGADFLARENYRGRRVATGAGILLAVGLVIVEGGRALLTAFDVGYEGGLTEARALVLVAVLGFALLGFIDDMATRQTAQGFRGHLRALAHGELTTGGLKLAGGGLLALVVAAPRAEGRLSRLVLDGALVALAANLGNLFDRAPGRVIKVGVLAWIPLAVLAGTGAVGVALAPLMGAVVGLLPDDLRERVMLGDAGANALGAALGVGAVLAMGTTARVVTVGVLVALNLASELVSFTRVIEAVRPLRAFDRWGRSPT
jgi:UDP-N-acetylmuramyl pentapeptide phosphotransferase/UDP-N-acetylglucosamine-1-phosphate transferase